VIFWLFARAIFDDGFEYRRWHAAVWIGLACLGLLQFFMLAPTGSPISQILGVALSLASLSFATLAVIQSISGWKVDLIEGRRRLRALVVGGVAAYIAIIGIAELMFQGRPVPLLASTVNAGGLAAVSALIAWSIVRVADNGLFSEPSLVLVEPDIIRTPNERRAPQGELQDPKALAALERLMMIERVYRQEGLTIGMLAGKLRLPEYRLRRLINQGLGYRNFNTYLNRFRIEDAKMALADPEQAEVPILTIAMDAGFQSLGPFNRAFKAETGATPSEYRHAALARRSS